ncbi:MAG: 30S ribosomal protein S18 [bacterium]|nr:30S ribosomal protein S18 [bacterium]
MIQRKRTSSRFNKLAGKEKLKCFFCKKDVEKMNYKAPDTLRNFTTEGGRILPRRITGLCSKHQKVLTNAIKRARIMAILPYSTRGD